MRDRALGSTIRLKFTTTDANGAPVAPSSAFTASDFRIYKDGSATEKTTTNGITVTSPFDSVTGRHLIEIDTSNSTGDVGFWASGSAYFVELNTAKTVNSQSVSGLEIGSFSLELQTADVRKVGGTSQTAGDLAALLATLAGYVDTEVAAIKAKTDNLPSDPADASDIAASFSTVNSTLSTIAAYIDTEVAAIKAKTDNLPTDPADQSAVEAAITAATSGLATAAALSTVEGKIDVIDDYIDTEVAAIKARTDLIPADPADASDIAASFAAVNTKLDTIDDLIDTEIATLTTEVGKIPKQGETRRYTQIAANEGNKTADVSIGAPL